MSLKDRLLKTGSIKETGMIDESEVYTTRDFAPTQVPMINVALSADVYGGVSAGVTTWAGPSRHFKTMFCLLCAKAYMDKYSDALLLFYDSEFGSPPDYFRTVGIDTKRVIHVPITTYEQLRSDIYQKIKEIQRGEHVFIAIDSLGNLASSKEAKDAENEHEAADFTRAKVNKSLFRIITPHLRLKNIPLHNVQHTYDTMEMYSKKIVSGGQGTMLASDNLFIIGRQQDKDGSELNGYNFVINVEKSRYVKEKSKILITVSFNEGIKRWSGLLDLAVEGNYINKISTQSYCKVDRKTGEILENVKYKRKDIEYNSELWKDLFTNTDFAEYIKSVYGVSHGDLVSDDETIEDLVDTEE